MLEEKEKTYRLSKVMKEFNLGTDTIVDFLKAKGHAVPNDLNAKLSSDMYELLVKEYSSDKRTKEKAEQIKGLHKEVKPIAGRTAQEPEFSGPSLSAQDLRSNLMPQRQDAKPKAVEQAPEEAQPVAAQVQEQEELPVPSVTAKEPLSKTEPAKEVHSPEMQGLKVVGQLDLNQLNRKKKGPAKQEKPEKLAQPVAAVEAKVQPLPTELALQPQDESVHTLTEEAPLSEAQPEQVPAETLIRASDHTPRLEGLKVMGRIELPDRNTRSTSRDAQDANSERSKRKRRTTGLPTPPAATNNGTAGAKDRKGARPSSGNNGAPRRPADNNSSSSNPMDAQNNLRNTLAGMHQGPNRRRQKVRRGKRDQRAALRDRNEQEKLASSNILEVNEFLTANELANLMNISVNQVIAKCMELGMFVSINQRIDADVIQLLAEEFGYEVNFISLDEAFIEDEDFDEDEELQPRSPIVTVMGHVDHGKTSLLDSIRNANVIAGEAGGITQHIGAYEVTLDNDRKITFLDTPGHEAFTAMRARGAQVTDIAIIVIAADDQVMPQTREAINHAQAAGVPMVFAINKVDKEGAQPEKIKEQLAQMNLLVEDWGGKYQSQEISARKGQGIHELLDKVLLEADLLDLKANPDKPARGTVIEAQLDKGRGVVTTILVQNGTLKIGDILVANNHFGRIKAMTDERQHRVKEAGPSVPVQILGLDGVPQAGDKFQVFENEREARELATKRQQLIREQSIRMQKHITLEEIARRAAVGDFKELNVIVKGDVDGSVEALSDSLLKLSTEEVAVSIIMKGVGQITESDVLLASASDAIIVGFQVRPSSSARKLAAQEQIDIRLYSIIYDAINEVKDALEGLLAPKVEEEVVGTAEVREVFRISKIGAVAGCMVIEGKINRANPVRLIRDGIVVYTGKVNALKRFKDDVREVAEGFECGISIENFHNIEPGDHIEAFTEVEVKRTLA